MKMERISQKLIKPLTPTPQNLKNFKLSIVDKIMAQGTIAVVLFYESKPRNLSHLEESLSKVLVQFYPLSGRYDSKVHIVDCSDQGVVFIEAETLDTMLTMDMFMKSMETQTINHLVPFQSMEVDGTSPLLSIQMTHFPCGGLAIAIAVSHTIFDAFSLGVFIAAWSNATINLDRKINITPSFELPTLLPYKDNDLFVTTNYVPSQEENFLVKRLVFGKEAITRMRSALSLNPNGKMISRVVVVSALIAKALIALECYKYDKASGFVFTQAINMRDRTSTPLKKKLACGNLAFFSLTPHIAAAEAEKMGLQELVNLIGDCIVKDIADHAEILTPNQDVSDIFINNFKKISMIMGTPATNAIAFSDWSKFGFHQVDFGFGKPVLTRSAAKPMPISCIGLMSNKEGDGIEAWVHLKENDMHLFEQDEEIKSFTT